ncbi:MAG: alpha/beta hydrolase [Bacteroidetes bacterium]|nr:alpha/beta hydrolase [Bacteroidota bacterium]
MQTGFITYQSAKIFYRITGNGKPVLLLHGFGEDGEIWNRQPDALHQYQLIIPDLPGSGQSAFIADMSIEGMATAMKALLDETGFQQPVTIIGHSMGGYIMLALAEKYPQAIKAIGLFHSSAFADSEEKKAARQKSIAFIEEHGAYEFLKTSIPGLFYKGADGQSPSDPESIAALVEKGRQFTPEALVAYYQAMINRPDRTALLKTIPCPVLFIIGVFDMAVPFTQSMQQSHFPELSYITILRQSAHMGMWEETAKANAALLNFLEGATR